MASPVNPWRLPRLLVTVLFPRTRCCHCREQASDLRAQPPGEDRPWVRSEMSFCREQLSVSECGCFKERRVVRDVLIEGQDGSGSVIGKYLHRAFIGNVWGELYAPGL